MGLPMVGAEASALAPVVGAGLSLVILDEYYCFWVVLEGEDVGHGHQVVACVEGADYPPLQVLTGVRVAPSGRWRGGAVVVCVLMEDEVVFGYG